MPSIRCVLIFSTLSLALLTPALAQEDPKELARQYMEVAELTMEATKAIDDAREQIVQAANLDTTFIKANFMAGRFHLLTINKSDAVQYFMRVYRQDPEYQFDLEYWIGKAYQYGLEFDKAIDFFNRYKAKLAKKPNYMGKDKVSVAAVDRSIYECENGKEYVANPGNFSIVNIGREINSEFDDYGPVLNEAENEIIFTTRRRDGNMNENVADDNKPWEDIFHATKSGDKWTEAKNIGEPVNKPTHDSNLALSADGNTLFIYKDENGGDIYYCERQPNGNWSEPIPLPGIINSSFEEKSITITKDEKTLYFTSDRPGGFGSIDIYRATKDGKGHWSNVKNLGPVINTEFDEEGPFIDRVDGLELYFSSRGHKGMGDHDIFKSTFDPNKNEWSEPVNLGYPINTPDADVFFMTSTDSKRAYYSSLREDGMGYQDIYMITIPEGLKNVEPVTTKDPVVTKDPVETPKDPVVNPIDTAKQVTVIPKDPEPIKDPEPKKVIKPLKYIVSIIDAESKDPIKAKVRMVGARDNVIVKSKITSPGVYEFTITSQQPKDYRLSADLDGYVFENQNVRIEGASTEDKTLDRTIEMRKIAVTVTKVLRNIYFDFNKATFKTESYTELNKLEAMLRQNSRTMVEIGGHTDGVGPKAYNIFLSRKRAEAVKDYLTKKGIDPRRVKAVGYGKSKPLVSNDDEDEGRELNRRVEFKVLSN